MKLTVSVTILLFITCFARANYALDIQKGPVSCEAQDLRASINSERTQVLVEWFDREPRTQTFYLADKESDGHSYAIYTSMDNDVIFTLADKNDISAQHNGDSIYFRDSNTNYILKCR